MRTRTPEGPERAGPQQATRAGPPVPQGESPGVWGRRAVGRRASSHTPVNRSEALEPT